MNKRQQGFTLVEIAIVLIIIGLLLGGILKGQELITSARVRNLADQNSGIQAAYFGFIDRFRRVPGDWAAAEATVAIGETVILPGTVGTVGEIDNDFIAATAVWEQLARSGFLNPSFTLPTAAPTTAAAYALNAPSNAFGGALVLTRNNAYTNVAAPTARLTLRLGNAVPVAVARELDTKLDDGAPNTGSLRLTTTITAANDPDGTVTATAACLGDNSTPPVALNDLGASAIATSVYNIAGAEPNCGQAFIY